MKKYPGIILAMTTAVMITSCSSVLNGGDTKSTEEGAASESVTTEAQTDAIKIENETDPEPFSETETSPDAETSAPSQESKPSETEAMPVYTVTAVQKTMYVTQPSMYGPAIRRSPTFSPALEQARRSVLRASQPTAGCGSPIRAGTLIYIRSI